jgi:hypothetical protein
MSKKSLDVLKAIYLNKKDKRPRRLTDTLRHPEQDYTQDWYMCVPKCFNDALDIKKTTRVERNEEGKRIEKLVWTQGAAFSFKIGDVLYDTPLAYRLPWTEALQHITIALQVKQVVDRPESDGPETRSTSDVLFGMFAPDALNMRLNKVGEYTLPQHAFVRFLIAGPEEELKNLVSPKKTRSEKDGTIHI